MLCIFAWIWRGVYSGSAGDRPRLNTSGYCFISQETARVIVLSLHGTLTKSRKCGVECAVCIQYIHSWFLAKILCLVHCYLGNSLSFSESYHGIYRKLDICYLYCIQIMIIIWEFIVYIYSYTNNCNNNLYNDDKDGSQKYVVVGLSFKWKSLSPVLFQTYIKFQV